MAQELPWLRSAILTAILCALLLPPRMAMAQEFISGQVVSIDRGKGAIIMLLDQKPAPADQPPVGAAAGTRPAPGPSSNKARAVTITMTVNADSKTLPECLQPGSAVLAWGAFAPESTDHFMADTVRGGGAGEKDKSGVRARLHRCRGGRQGYRGGGQGASP